MTLRIDGLPPAMLQSALAALPKAAEAFRAGVDSAQRPPEPAVPLATPGPATSVQMLVALAAADPAIERRRRLADEAGKGLALLERLHAELAAGIAPPERLQELAEWSESFTPPEDPALAALASDIELRVRVELAKHDVRA